MSLFRRKSDNSSLIFHCLDLSDTELDEITKLVVENGGKMGDSCPLPIKFMNSAKYTEGMYPSYRIYNVDFIRACVKTSKLVNLFSYRLGPKMLCESCMVFNFIHGHCLYKGILDVISIKSIPVEPDLSLLCDDEQIDEDNILETLVEKYQQVGGRQLSIDESQPLVSYTYSQNVQSPGNSGNSSIRQSSTGRNRKAHSRSFEKEDNIKSNFPHPSPQTDNSTDDIDFLEVEEEAPDSVHWRSVPNSQEPQATDTKETSKITSPYDSPMSLRSKTRGNSTRTEAKVSVTENSVNVKTSPNSSLSSSKSKNLRNSEKRSTWIIPNDDWMQRTDRVCPVTENMQCNNKNEPLLRPNLAFRRKSKTLSPNKLPNPIHRLHATSINAAKNKPGPSGLTSQKPAAPQIALDSSTDDEDLPVQNNSSANNSKHSHESISRVRTNQKQSDEVVNVRRSNENTETVDRRGTWTRRILPDSDSDEEAPQATREDTSDTRNANESSISNLSDDDDGSDDVFPKRRKKEHTSWHTRQRKALQYAKNWRSNMETSRPTKVGITRMPFTKSEQRAMVNFLLTHKDIRLVTPKGLKIWHTMLLNGILPHRTPQSLQNHFVKILLPHIQDYFDEMSEDHRKQFKAIQNGART